MLPVPATGQFPLLDDLRETIGEESGNQSYSPGCGLTASQSSDISASRKSSGMVTLPIHAPSRDFQGDRGAGRTVASGRPRLVIVMLPPRSPISSRSARHFALNSVTLTTRCGIWLSRQSVV